MFDLDGTDNKCKSGCFIFLVNANLCHYLKNHAMVDRFCFTAIEVDIEPVSLT